MRDDTRLSAAPLRAATRAALYGRNCFTVGDVRMLGKDRLSGLTRAALEDVEKNLGWAADYTDRARLVAWLREFAQHHGCAPYLNAAADMLEADGRAKGEG